jgi:uncharacterized membrane protein
MKKVNLKFLIAAILLFIVGLLLRPILLGAGMDNDYFAFFPGLVIIPAIYFFMASLSPQKHNHKQAVYLTLGVIVIKLFLEAGNYNTAFYAGSLGIVMGLMIIEITLIPKIKNWFFT